MRLRADARAFRCKSLHDIPKLACNFPDLGRGMAGLQQESPRFGVVRKMKQLSRLATCQTIMRWFYVDVAKLSRTRDSRQTGLR